MGRRVNPLECCAPDPPKKAAGKRTRLWAAPMTRGTRRRRMKGGCVLPKEVVSEDGCSSGVSLFANFFEEAGTTQSGITLQSLEDIWFVRIQIAGFDAGAGRRRSLILLGLRQHPRFRVHPRLIRSDDRSGVSDPLQATVPSSGSQRGRTTRLQPVPGTRSTILTSRAL